MNTWDGSGGQSAMWERMLAMLVSAAREQPNRKLDIRDATGRVIATLTVHDAPVRPKDMPRNLRPKHKLSKRQRAAARAEKLGRTREAAAA